MSTLSLLEPQSTRTILPRSSRRDCFYHWFSEVERQGEDTTFRLGRVAGTELAPSWTYLPHHTFDGLGGLAHALRAQGRELSLPALPGPYPGAFQRTCAALRQLARRAPKPLEFRSQAPTRGDARALSAWALFTGPETDALRARARDHGTSLNAFFLSGLTAAIRPLLAGGPGTVNWIVPVNMRGVDRTLAATDNQASALDISFPVQASAAEIDRIIREQQRRHVHWGVWELLKWLGAAGPSVVRLVARRELSIRKQGSFSNMGAVRVPPSALDSGRPEWWMAINPVQRARPLGAACLTYNGRLTLTLQAHPVLGLHQSAVQSVLDAWVEALQRPASADSTSTAGTTTLLPGSGGTKFT